VDDQFGTHRPHGDNPGPNNAVIARYRGDVDRVGEFTRTDTGTNPANNPTQLGNNLKHVLVLHGKAVTAQYLEEFTRLRLGMFGALHERVEPRTTELRIAASGSNRCSHRDTDPRRKP
jgi:hypothetical protein